MNLNQRTIKNKIKFNGVGLHSGKKVSLVLVPALPNHGIVFKRTDIKNNNQIDANFENVKEATPLCTTIQNEFGVSVSTIEHLLGALCGEEVDNLLIEIDSEELPVMDGSAKNFVKKIRETGFKTYDTSKKYIKVLKKYELKDGKKFISIEPCENDLIVDFEVIYNNPLIGTQRKEISLIKNDLDEIYNSRTFCLYEDIDKVRKMGLGKGGNLENVVIVQGDKVLNNDGLRYNNEFVMHKILDCLGDLVLSDYKMLGKVICSQGGHKLTNQLLRSFFSDKNNYSIIEFNEKKLPNTVLYNKTLAATA
tara:strand:- start:1318 stop:2238 length:921 start_codon:yes stop_codon:yes gene_type:complete